MSCKKRTYNDDSKSKGFFDFLTGEQKFKSDVNLNRKCSSEYSKSNKLVMPAKKTRVYHWTNSDLALTNPHEYLSDLVKVSNDLNLKISDYKTIAIPSIYGAAGAGLYVAPNPFASSEYGKNLISFEIKEELKFPSIEKLESKNPSIVSESIEAFFKNCAGFIYPYGVRISSDSSDTMGLALVLWDLSVVDPKSVLTFSSSSKFSSNNGPFFEELFNENKSAIQRIIMFSAMKSSTTQEEQAKFAEIKEYWAKKFNIYDWK